MSTAGETASADKLRQARSDAWVRAEVKRALAEADRADRPLLDHATVMSAIRNRYGFAPME